MRYVFRDSTPCFVIPLNEALEKAGPYVGPRGGLWADLKHTIHWDPKKHGTARLEAMLADLVPGDKVKGVADQLSKLSSKQIEKLLDDVKGKIEAISSRDEAVPVTLMRWQRIFEKVQPAPEKVPTKKEPRKIIKEKPKEPEQLGFVLSPPQEKPSEPGWERMPEATESARIAAEGAIGKRKVTSLSNRGWTFEDVMPKTLAQAGTDAGLTRQQAKKMKDAGVRVVRNLNAEPAEPPPTPKPKPKPKAKAEPKPKKKKQAPKGKRRIERTGEHIWGSRKDLATRAIETSKDFEDLTYEDAKLLVTKARLVEVPQLSWFASNGTSPGVAHMALSMINAIGAKPASAQPEVQAAYVEEIREILGSLKQVKTLDDFNEMRMEMAHKWRTAPSWEPVPNVDPDITREEALNLVKRLKKDDPHKEFRATQRSWGDPIKVVQKIPSPYDAVGKRFTDFIRARGKNFKEAMRAAVRIDQMTADEGYDHLNHRSEKKPADTKKDLEAARRRLGLEGDTSRGWSRAKQVAGEVQRKGETVKVRTANEKRIKETFNLREVDYGQEGYMTQADREYHTKALEGAMHDMSEALGVDPQVLSMNGRLGVALGARGRGKAAAHYETGRHVINITKFRGGGALAHEWGHALDNIIATTVIENDKKGGGGRYLIEDHGHSKLPPEVRRAATRVYDALMKAPDPEKAREQYFENTSKMRREINGLITKSNERVQEIRKLTEKPANTEDRLKKRKEAMDRLGRLENMAQRGDDSIYQGAINRTKADIKQLSDSSFMQSPADVKHAEELAEDVELLRQVINRKSNILKAYSKLPADASDFAKSGQVLGAKYWGNDQEMFARAFEAFVQDQLENSGRRNSYLVDGTVGGVVVADLEVFKVAQYPIGREREVINAAIEDLMRVLQEEKHLEKALRLMIPLQELRV